MDKETTLPLSFSSLKAFARSPLAFIEYKTNKKEPTPAMRFGTLVHRAILEPERYSRTVAIYEGQRRGKAWKEFEAEHADMDIVTTTEAMTIRQLAHRVAEVADGRSVREQRVAHERHAVLPAQRRELPQEAVD